MVGSTGCTSFSYWWVLATAKCPFEAKNTPWHLHIGQLVCSAFGIRQATFSRPERQSDVASGDTPYNTWYATLARMTQGTLRNAVEMGGTN